MGGACAALQESTGTFATDVAEFNKPKGEEVIKLEWSMTRDAFDSLLTKMEDLIILRDVVNVVQRGTTAKGEPDEEEEEEETMVKPKVVYQPKPRVNRGHTPRNPIVLETHE